MNVFEQVLKISELLLTINTVFIFSLKITGFDYLGAEMTIEIGELEVIIDVTRIGDFPLILFRNESVTWTPNGPIHHGQEESLTEGKPVTTFVCVMLY